MQAEQTYCFRIYLKDKGVSSAGLLPEQFLSPEAVQRRFLHEVLMDESDLPVSDAYLQQIRDVGTEIVLTSKWMKTVLAESADSAAVCTALSALAFVDSLRCVWHGEDRLQAPECSADTFIYVSTDTAVSDIYGFAREQTDMLNGEALHSAGFKGEGMRIAVIDAGFLNVNRIEAFKAMKTLGVKNIVFPAGDVYCDDHHGCKSLSCLAASLPGIMLGSAPEASYLLVKSEDVRFEEPIEEDYWAAAVEYADSVGVDVISTSLGYFRFDSMPDYYTLGDLDGRTAFCSRVAEIAARKGMLVVVSAGNEGASDWAKITFPADAAGVLTVGSVNSEKEKSTFSSVGMTADYRIKPDVAALGSGVAVIDSSGEVQYVNGTSFSAPTVAGFAACLLQAFPLLKNSELIELLKTTSSLSATPDVLLGYGIPDMKKAYNKAKSNGY